jgi:hypothetical protein
MENIKNKKIKKMNKIYLGFTILFVILISTGSIFALNYFFTQKDEKVDFETNLPTFTVERIANNSNNLDKKLLLISVPILSNKYVHDIKIQHEGILNINGCTVDVPLFLKLTTAFKDEEVRKATDIKVECATAESNREYTDDTRPQLKTVNGTTKVIINYTIQQNKIHGRTTSDLISKYELVDKNGNAYGGGTAITTKITQTA